MNAGSGAKWAWAALAGGVLMAICAILWGTSASERKIDTIPSEKAIFREGEGPPEPRFVADTRLGGSLALPQGQFQASPKKPGPKQSAERQKPSVKDMFPMGNIVVNPPGFLRSYRQPAELFPSFAYAGKLWTQTGLFAYASRLDLVPTGYRLADGRGLFAIANTAAPGKALFVRSARNPEKFAIYR